MILGQDLKLIEGRISPIDGTQQNGDDASFACLVPLDGSLDFDGVAGIVGEGVGAGSNW